MNFKIIHTLSLLIALGASAPCFSMDETSIEALETLSENFLKTVAIKTAICWPLYTISSTLAHESGHAFFTKTLFNTPSHIMLGRDSRYLLYSSKYISIGSSIIPGMLIGVKGFQADIECTSKGLRDKPIRKFTMPNRGYKTAIMYAGGPLAHLLAAAGLTYASHAVANNINETDNIEKLSNSLSSAVLLTGMAVGEAALGFFNLDPRKTSFRSLNDGAGILIALQPSRQFKKLWTHSMRTGLILAPTLIAIEGANLIGKKMTDSITQKINGDSCEN